MVFTEDRTQQETITTVKRNLNDKLQVSNSEIHFTRECVNLVTHTNFTAICVTEDEFWLISSMLEEPVISWNADLAIGWNNAK